MIDVVAGIAVCNDRVLLCKRHPSAVAEWSEAWGARLRLGSTREMSSVGSGWRMCGDILVAGPTPWGRDVPWTSKEMRS